MKRLTEERRNYLEVVTRKRTYRGLESKRKAHEHRCKASLQPGQAPSTKKRWMRRTSRTNCASERLIAPSIFGISISAEKTRIAFVHFLRRMRQLALGRQTKVYIDFDNAVQMYPDGVLLFAATLDHINREIAPRHLIKCNYPKDNVVEQLFQHLGLLAWMGKPARLKVSADNVRYWEVASDTLVTGATAESIVEEYQRRFPTHDATKLFRGLTEAMTNCRHHAYDDPTGTCRVGRDTRWWMFSQIKDEAMSVVICDLGIGIPASLRQGRKWKLDVVFEAVDKIGIGRKDSHFIGAATELGRSRTNEEHRGKGLPEIKNVIDSIGAGYLKIYSGKGTYYFSGETRQEEKRDSSISTPGTLIQWHVPLPKAGSK